MSKLLKICTEFREGLLTSNTSKQKCFMVSGALVGYLQFAGYDCELTEGDVGDWEHYWITLADGRIVDATADQFKAPDGTPMPKVYIGAKPEWYKVVPTGVSHV